LTCGRSARRWGQESQKIAYQEEKEEGAEVCRLLYVLVSLEVIA
jgi:hypothetical protein